MNVSLMFGERETVCKMKKFIIYITENLRIITDIGFQKCMGILSTSTYTPQ